MLAVGLALVLYPVVWLGLLPFRLVGIAGHGALELVREVILVPVRILANGARSLDCTVATFVRRDVAAPAYGLQAARPVCVVLNALDAGQPPRTTRSR